MLNRLKRLIHRSTQIQAGCLAELQAISRKDEKLREKEQAIEEQLNSLSLLETLNELLDQVVSKDKIFTVLRKVAVVRQRRTQLELEKREIQEERHLLARQREEQLALRKVWWLKEQKYVHLRKKVLRDRLRKQLFIEEMEQEENIHETSHDDQ